MVISVYKSPLMKDIFGMYIRPVRLTHSDKLYVFHVALVRADQSKTTLWESRDVEMI